MVSGPTSSIRKDEDGMTAVIEFLSAFTLFLMILTAFLSLAQLEMGSNDTSVDRLDRSAAPVSYTHLTLPTILRV